LAKSARDLATKAAIDANMASKRAFEEARNAAKGARSPHHHSGHYNSGGYLSGGSGIGSHGNARMSGGSAYAVNYSSAEMSKNLNNGKTNSETTLPVYIPASSNSTSTKTSAAEGTIPPAYTTLPYAPPKNGASVGQSQAPSSLSSADRYDYETQASLAASKGFGLGAPSHPVFTNNQNSSSNKGSSNYESQMETLVDMGFLNVELNRDLLEVNDGNVEKVVEVLARLEMK
jgi:hypothetical protein